ncbi:DUF1186 domain-containing protein [Methylobacterium symbioticum]|uniref:Protein translocase subunit SecA n=1 Tax=Methylobacterium symbioticum TaxID=2584084 RepID=A0A509EBZ6_9HYPH|nr:DUF1186 domain-containing protein [Methylobacterium symbioticum]VUD71690.1 hypothetical protein MET9862_02276 [Methylobacterium symbioticum]
MDDAALIEALSGSLHLPKAALREALERPEVLAPETLRLLEKSASGADLEEAEASLMFWGLHVLAHARDGRALPPLLRLLRQDGDTVDAYLGDAVTTTLAKVVASLFDGDPAPIFALILDSTVDDPVRQALFSACITLCHTGRIPREALHALLVRFDEASAAVEEAPAWIGWEEAIAQLGFRDLAPRVEAARRDGRITDEFSDFAWFKETLRKAEARPDDLRRFDRWSYGTLDDPLDDLAWTAEGAGEPQRNPYKDVGRNDPCPCGSGKKFKKCCLPTVEADL